MRDAFIVSALRTPIGKKKGTLSNMHPADLGAVVLSATFDQVDLDPELVEDVIFGCVDTVGPQAGDIARTCWLAAGLPEHVPGTPLTVNVAHLNKLFILLLKLLCLVPQM